MHLIVFSGTGVYGLAQQVKLRQCGDGSEFICSNKQTMLSLCVAMLFNAYKSRNYIKKSIQQGWFGMFLESMYAVSRCYF